MEDSADSLRSRTIKSAFSMGRVMVAFTLEATGKRQASNWGSRVPASVGEKSWERCVCRTERAGPIH